MMIHYNILHDIEPIVKRLNVGFLFSGKIFQPVFLFDAKSKPLVN